jgi:molecular chaperone DnaK
MKQEAEANAESDKKAKEAADKINQADSLIFQTEKQLKEFGDKIPADKKGPIEDALKKLKEAHASKDLVAIDAAMNELNTVFQAASQEMYNASQSQGGPQADAGSAQSGPTEGKSKTDGEVTDVDFEEVK